MTDFNSLKIMSLNCDAKKEEKKKKNTIRNTIYLLFNHSIGTCAPEISY